MLLENVRVPARNVLLGEGRGFEIAQGRLGPGRIHDCMRSIGKAEEALEKMVKRLNPRVAFGKRIVEHSVWEQRIAEARIDLEMNRLLCLKAADMMDKVGNKSAQLEIAMIKVAAPRMTLKVIDQAIQAFGGAGVSEEAGLARDYASMRTMRLADGPDEVHCRALASLNFGNMQALPRTETDDAIATASSPSDDRSRLDNSATCLHELENRWCNSRRISATTEKRLDRGRLDFSPRLRERSAT